MRGKGKKKVDEPTRECQRLEILDKVIGELFEGRFN